MDANILSVMACLSPQVCLISLGTKTLEKYKIKKEGPINGAWLKVYNAPSMQAHL